MALPPILSRALEYLDQALKDEGWDRSRFYRVENPSGIFGLSGVLIRKGGVGTYSIMTARKDFDPARTHGHWSATTEIFNRAENNKGVLLGYVEPRRRIYVFERDKAIPGFSRTYRPKEGTEPREQTVEFRMSDSTELHEWLRTNR